MLSLVRQSLSIDYIFHIAGPILAFVKASIMLRNICTFHRFCLLSAVLVVAQFLACVGYLS